MTNLETLESAQNNNNTVIITKHSNEPAGESTIISVNSISVKLKSIKEEMVFFIDIDHITNIQVIGERCNNCEYNKICKVKYNSINCKYNEKVSFSENEIKNLKNICEDNEIKWTYYNSSKSFYIHAIIGNKTRLILVKNLEEMKRYI